MKKEISAYMELVKKQLESGNITAEFIEKLLIRIQFYQHERLVHLIVTMTFAVMTVLSVVMLVTAGGTGALLLTVLFLGLVIPYISHYYFLENSVQALYKLYYEALEKIDG